VIEAEVTCECRAIQLADLGVSLTHGMVVYLEAEQARRSLDLHRASKVRGVTVRYVQRFRERRPDAPAPAPAVPSVPQHRVPEPAVPLHPEDIAHQVVALLLPQFQAMLQQAIAALPTSRVLVPGSVVPGAGVPGTVVPKDDVPVFIPSRIGRDDLVPAFEVRVVEGEGSGVADAAAALKAARKSEKAR
jgi:hypothetical protein